jgi:hypothetical protein
MIDWDAPEPSPQRQAAFDRWIADPQNWNTLLRLVRSVHTLDKAYGNARLLRWMFGADFRPSLRVVKGS